MYFLYLYLNIHIDPSVHFTFPFQSTPTNPQCLPHGGPPKIWKAAHVALFLSDVMTPQTQLANIVPWCFNQQKLERRFSRKVGAWVLFFFKHFICLGYENHYPISEEAVEVHLCFFAGRNHHLYSCMLFWHILTNGCDETKLGRRSRTRICMPSFPRLKKHSGISKGHGYLGGGFTKCYFHPYLKKWSNLTSICFKWVENPSPTYRSYSVGPVVQFWFSKWVKNRINHYFTGPEKLIFTESTIWMFPKIGVPPIPPFQ